MFAERLAFELQTCFRSSPLLSLRNFRRERIDNPKYVCSPQATERWNRSEHNSYVICKKLGVIRWLDCPCEIIWKLHFSSLSKQFLYVFFSFCLLPSSFFFPPFILFSCLVAPLPVLSFQKAKMFLKCFVLGLLTKFTSQCSYTWSSSCRLFFVFLCKEFLVISHNFERFGNFCYVVTGGIKSTYNLWF